MRRFLVFLVWCTLVWIVLWRDLSWANLLSGVVVSAAVLALFPFAWPPDRLVFDPIALVRFGATFALSVVRANLIVAWEIVTPRNRINEAVVAVPLSTDAPAVITMVSHAIGLAPGTMVVDIEHDPTVLHVHVLHLRSVEDVRAEVFELERLALAAIHGRSDA